MTSEGTPSDADRGPSLPKLLHRVGNESDGAFLELQELYGPLIRAIVASHAGHRNRALFDEEDAMQEIWMKLLAEFRRRAREPAEFRTEKHFKSWLGSLVRNCMNSLHRFSNRKKRTITESAPDVDPEYLPSTDSDPVTMVQDREAMDFMVRCIPDLPARQAEMVRGYWFERSTQRELAMQFDLSEGMVRRELAAANATLAHRLREFEP